MRGFLRTGSVLMAATALAAPAAALERTSRRMTDELSTGWGSSDTLTLAYYNTCTGWLWVWGDWSPGEQVGVCYDTGVPLIGSLNTTWLLTFYPAPSGYGFTGTIAVETACDCTGAVLAAQPFLPTTGWNAWSWGGLPVPQEFLLKAIWAAPNGLRNSTSLASDRPVAGPTGPPACGRCYPTTRTARSLYFGVGGSACPGTTLFDGLCDVEFLVDAGVKYVVSVDDASWGQVKALYR